MILTSRVFVSWFGLGPITSVTDESVAGEITYSYTSDDEDTYTLMGTFEVVHCAY